MSPRKPPFYDPLYPDPDPLYPYLSAPFYSWTSLSGCRRDLKHVKNHEAHCTGEELFDAMFEWKDTLDDPPPTELVIKALCARSTYVRQPAALCTGILLTLASNPTELINHILDDLNASGRVEIATFLSGLARLLPDADAIALGERLLRDRSINVLRTALFSCIHFDDPRKFLPALKQLAETPHGQHQPWWSVPHAIALLEVGHFVEPCTEDPDEVIVHIFAEPGHNSDHEAIWKSVRKDELQQQGLEAFIRETTAYFQEIGSVHYSPRPIKDPPQSP